MTVVWLVFGDQCRHFSKGMLMSNFEGAGEIIWPMLSLFRLTDRMRGEGEIDRLLFPEKWKAWLDNRNTTQKAGIMCLVAVPDEARKAHRGSHLQEAKEKTQRRMRSERGDQTATCGGEGK